MKSSFGKTSSFQQGLTNKTGLLSLSALLLNSVYYHNYSSLYYKCFKNIKLILLIELNYN